MRESVASCSGIDMGNQHTPTQDTVIHVRVSEEERRKMAQRALADHRPLSNWARVQLLKAFEPEVHDERPIADAFKSTR